MAGYIPRPLQLQQHAYAAPSPAGKRGRGDDDEGDDDRPRKSRGRGGTFKNKCLHCKATDHRWAQCQRVCQWCGSCDHSAPRDKSGFATQCPEALRQKGPNFYKKREWNPSAEQLMANRAAMYAADTDDYTHGVESRLGHAESYIGALEQQNAALRESAARQADVYRTQGYISRLHEEVEEKDREQGQVEPGGNQQGQRPANPERLPPQQPPQADNFEIRGAADRLEPLRQQPANSNRGAAATATGVNTIPVARPNTYAAAAARPAPRPPAGIDPNRGINTFPGGGSMDARQANYVETGRDRRQADTRGRGGQPNRGQGQPNRGQGQANRGQGQNNRGQTQNHRGGQPNQGRGKYRGRGGNNNSRGGGGGGGRGRGR